MTYARRRDTFDALVLHSHYAMDTTLYLDWPLLKNLEVLSLDMGDMISGRSESFKVRLVQMAQHLNLKSLILYGVSYEVNRFERKDGEAWLSALEGDKIDEESGSPRAGLNGWTPCLMKLFRGCSRPGGQIHFVNDVKDYQAFHSTSYKLNDLVKLFYN
ncbi:hypothetical protein ACHAPU_003164 [Fusarium lateritium]